MDYIDRAIKYHNYLSTEEHSIDMDKEEALFQAYTRGDPIFEKNDRIGWFARALVADKETQALQEELINTNAEKLHAQMVADAAIEELNALKEKLKDGVIVPRTPNKAMLKEMANGYYCEQGWSHYFGEEPMREC